MCALITAREWLHVIRLPAYAPNLNPTNGIDHLATIVKYRLKRIQYRPELTDAFFAQTGLTLGPTPR